ncbi:MAG TPA: KpsF/GutQ family sugar-phosphate isomerase [Syntrophales bacterium]|jgi:arabinose-5-phosphate isomerase
MKAKSKGDEALKQAREVLKIEAECILGLIPKLDQNFSKAVETIFGAKGRVIVSGIGKSGLIGRKIVATFTSTGTPAIFLHPVEGMHGDLGIVTKGDVLIAISNSGETAELNELIARIGPIGLPLITLTGNPKSTLGRSSDIVIDVGVAREACPFGLAPTSSTTAALAMGDALAVALTGKRNFGEKDFLKFHPGGTLGQRLISQVKEAMITGERIPRVYAGSPALEAVNEIDRRNQGFVLITDRKDHLKGILTDGDVRRCVKRGVRFEAIPVDDIMTTSPRAIDESATLAKTVETMETLEITTLVVTGKNNRLKGYIHLHDIFGRGGTLRMYVPNGNA